MTVFALKMANPFEAMPLMRGQFRITLVTWYLDTHPRAIPR